MINMETIPRWSRVEARFFTLVTQRSVLRLITTLGVHVQQLFQAFSRMPMTGQAPTADRAKGLVEQFQSLFNRQSDQLKNQAGTVLLVVDSAKIICSETIPARKINTLKVADPRSVVEGKRLANIEDVARGRNIKPWSCARSDRAGVTTCRVTTTHRVCGTLASRPRLLTRRVHRRATRPGPRPIRRATRLG